MALQPIWIPAPSRMNRAACSYTVTSIPTRLRAAAVARPPMPAPIIAMDRGLAIDSRSPGICRLSRPEARLRQRRATLLGGECLQKCLHRGTLLARRHQREIIMLFRHRNEAQPRSLPARRNGHAPVGAMLRHRGCDRVVRARLIPVTVRARVCEQPVDQDARARALVAADHDAGGIAERRAA